MQASGLLGKGVVCFALTDIRLDMVNGKWAVADGDLGRDDFVKAVSSRKLAAGSTFRPTKYFCGEEELFHMHGKTYALSNQWGTGTQSHVAKLQEKYGLDIIIEW